MRYALFVIAIAVSPLPGQDMVWQVTGTTALSLGRDWAQLGDVDGDGFDDWATVGTIRPGVLRDPTIEIVSGLDGSILRTDRPPQTTTVLDLEEVGDLDEDGVGDYAVSTVSNVVAPFVDYVQAWSGGSGALLWQQTGAFADFGFRMAGDIDLNGDARPDLLVGAEAEGAVYAYDHTGVLLYKVSINRARLSALGGDYDGDGAEDYLVGGATGDLRGDVSLFSGRTGEILVSGFGEFQGDNLGLGQVFGCGDIDGDGVLDFGGSSSGGFITPGVVRVFSGVEGRAIYTWRQPVGSTYGAEVAVGDLDRDGVQDLLIWPVARSVSGAGPGIEWRSLRNGEVVDVICGLPGSTTSSAFGGFSTVGRPQPSHPFPVIAVSEPGFGQYQGGFRGRLHLLRATPAGVTPLGPSCRGGSERAPQMGFTDWNGEAIELHLSGARPESAAVLVLGLSSSAWSGVTLPLSLDAFGFPGCSLFGSADVVVPVRTGVHGNRRGYASVVLPAAVNGSLGVTVHGQWLVWPGERSGSTSNALSWRL